MRPETALQRDMRDSLDKLGFKSVHVPNGAVLAGGGKRRAIQMNSLKADGLTVGFPDLIVFGPDRIGFIEVKVEGEYLSENQMVVEDWLTGWAGQSFAVCRSVDDVNKTLTEWGWI